MSQYRIALANVPIGNSPEESLQIALAAIQEAAAKGAAILCFPESFVPGYRIGRSMAPCDPDFLNRAWEAVDRAAGEAGMAVILGTERMEGNRLLITARVTNSDGTFAGFQDKVQLDPTEEGVYSPGATRRVFQCGELKFGVVICHEGWRYPETVRWAAQRGAQVVFHPHTEVVEDERFVPNGFADPTNSFHEKAMLCRAAENTCYFAAANNTMAGASTTSAVIAPDGTLLKNQPWSAGVLICDVDLSLATGLLAGRLRSTEVNSIAACFSCIVLPSKRGHESAGQRVSVVRHAVRYPVTAASSYVAQSNVPARASTVRDRFRRDTVDRCDQRCKDSIEPLANVPRYPVVRAMHGRLHGS